MSLVRSTLCALPELPKHAFALDELVCGRSHSDEFAGFFDEVFVITAAVDGGAEFCE
jgi:hypothetical protein